jgi:hypothetical protein
MPLPNVYPWNVGLDLSARLTLALLKSNLTLKQIYQTTPWAKTLRYAYDTAKAVNGPIDIANNHGTPTTPYDKPTFLATLDKLATVFEKSPYDKVKLMDLYVQDSGAWPPYAHALSWDMLHQGFILTYVQVPNRNIAGTKHSISQFFTHPNGNSNAAGFAAIAGLKMKDLYTTTRDPNSASQYNRHYRIARALALGILRCYPKGNYSGMWPNQDVFPTASGNARCCAGGVTCNDSDPAHYCETVQVSPGVYHCKTGSDDCS